ncbi:MAG: Cys-Gln thioester bond-forming surface protein [Longispora sp.]|nr:Cys-Gln thioester bond-forming surface protein [Longispora sp. (in: high G+C Gram-positive bacteria)]
MLNSQRLIRSGIAIGAIGLLAMGFATPASAEQTRGKVGTISHEDSDGEDNNRHLRGQVNNGKMLDYPISIIGMTTPPEDSKQQYVYCIDIKTALNLEKPNGNDGNYEQTTWGEATHIQQGNLDKINWILHNSFPSKTVDEVLDAAKQQDSTKSLKPARRDYVVYAATQAAVWHFSDKFSLKGAGNDHGKGVFSPEEYQQIKKVYDYLLSVAGSTPESPHVLSITPESASGPAGTKVGPYEVNSTVGDVKLDVEGGKAVNGNGEKITQIGNGGKFWLIKDAVGEVKVSAEGFGLEDISQVFVHERTPNKFQKVILPATRKGKVYAEVRATFTSIQTQVSESPIPQKQESPNPPKDAPPNVRPQSLPVTGVAIVGVAGVGALMLATGGGLLFLRKRRNPLNFEA